MLDILILLAILYACAYATAYFSYMMDNFYDQDMIFEGWLPFLQRTIGKDNFWYKPLGGCVKCANVWHSFLSFTISIWFLQEWGFWLVPALIAYVSVSNGILRKKLLNE